MLTTLFSFLHSKSNNNLKKKQVILHFINNGEATLPELARQLNFSVPTISKVVNDLITDDYVVDLGKVSTDGGRQPSQYGLNPNAAYFFGIDIRQFFLNIGVINFKGEFVKKNYNIPYSLENTPNALDTICQIVNTNINALPKEIRNKLVNIMVNISGRVKPVEGLSYSYFNFTEIPLSNYFSEQFKYPTMIDNDTRAMTYGEFIKGKNNTGKSILFINAGWGLGLGIIINGKVYHGKSGFAGELGHIKTYNNEIICHCGKKGCLETEASGSALYRKFKEQVKNGKTSILSKKMQDPNYHLTLEDIVKAVKKEDSLAINLLEEVGDELGRGVSGLINLFNPDKLIIGGTLSTTGAHLIDPLKSAIRKYSLNLVNKETLIERSTAGNEAGVVGACMLARSRIFEDYE